MTWSAELIESIARDILLLRVFVEGAIDFPEEEIDFISEGHVSERLERLIGSWRAEFLAGLHGEGDVVQRIGQAMIAKHKAARRLLDASPHADELYEEHDRGGAAQFANFDAELAGIIEGELAAAGVARARIVTQFFLAASYGIGRRAQLAELGPAFRLLAERLLRPELG